MSFDADVLVAGGGTVGLAAAAALSQAGFAVTLIERGPAPQAFAGDEVDLRVYALSPTAIRFLERLGVWPAIAAVRHGPYRAMQVWRDDPAKALSFDALPSGSLGSIVEHGLLKAALWRQSGRWQRRAGSGIEQLTADEDGASVTLSSGERLSARLLVIADGPDSPLRQQLGIDAIGWNYAQRALVAHVATEKPHGGVARQRFLPTGPLALLPLADGRCSIVWSCEAAMADSLLTLDDAAFALRLGTASGGVLGAITTVTARKSFPLRLAQVPEPVVPGAVVIGDAAHVVHPLAGQGVNLGLADAETLAATLAAARREGRGWWRGRTLKAYARQRAPETLEMLAMTDALHRVFARGDALPAVVGAGLPLVNALDPLKRWFGARAAGAA